MSMKTHSYPDSCLALKEADYLLQRKPILQNPFFVSLQNGQMSRETFVRSQQQFYHAVRFFSRPMAALMARLPTSVARKVLMHNLAEEHGYEEESELGFQSNMAHDLTFTAFLGTLGVDAETVHSEPERPPVKAFNLALLGACQVESVPLAFSCLGMIEYAFAGISAVIGAAVVDRGWIDKKDLVHYTLHAEIDKRHAAEFFEEVEEGCESEMQSGLSLGLHIFDELYSGIGQES